MKKLLKFLILISCLMLIVACSNNNDKGNKDNINNNQTNDQIVDGDESSTKNNNNNKDNNEANKNNDDPFDENDNAENDDGDLVVMENEAFKIYGPVPAKVIDNKLIVKGQARVFEAFVEYSLEDGHYIYEKGTVRAESTAPNWSDFTIEIQINDENKDAERLVIFEESAKDGSPIHEIIVEIE